MYFGRPSAFPSAGTSGYSSRYRVVRRVVSSRCRAVRRVVRRAVSSRCLVALSRRAVALFVALSRRAVALFVALSRRVVSSRCLVALSRCSSRCRVALSRRVECPACVPRVPRVCPACVPRLPAVASRRMRERKCVRAHNFVFRRRNPKTTMEKEQLAKGRRKFLCCRGAKKNFVVSICNTDSKRAGTLFMNLWKIPCAERKNLKFTLCKVTKAKLKKFAQSSH